MSSDSFSLNLSLSNSTIWQTNIELVLEQAKNDEACIIKRTDSARKQREDKANIMIRVTCVAAIALGILAIAMSPFFILPAIGLGICNRILCNRALKVIIFTEQEEQERLEVWRIIEKLSDLALWAKGRAPMNADNEHRNFSQSITPRFNRFLNCIFTQNATIQDPPSHAFNIFYPPEERFASSPPSVSLSISQLVGIYSIFREVAIYRYLESQSPHELIAANILAKSIDCSREQILSRLPQIPNITDVYERMAHQILEQADQIEQNEDNRRSLAKACRELPVIPLGLFSITDRRKELTVL